jgi:hypothetical protein
MSSLAWCFLFMIAMIGVLFLILLYYLFACECVISTSSSTNFMKVKTLKFLSSFRILWNQVSLIIPIILYKHAFNHFTYLLL